MTTRLIRNLVVMTAAAAIAPAAASAATISATGGAITLADNFANDGVCSLREMVQIANTDNAAIEDACTVAGDPLGDDTIELGAGEYTLTTPIDGTPDINDGDLEVDDFIGTNRLTIIGQGRANTIIDGGDQDRVFEASGGNFRLESLMVRDGQVTSNNGGGIVSSASMFLEDAVVTGNTILTAGSGGGVLMSGSAVLTLSNSSVDTNVSAGTGGGIELRQSASVTTQGAGAVEDNIAGSQGGGINVSQGAGGGADVTLNPGASVDNNTAVAVGGGIAHTIGTANSDVTLNGASITNNDVTESVLGTASGGGVHYVDGLPTQAFTVSNASTIDGNTATGDEATGAGINAQVNSAGFNIAQSSVSSNTTTVQDDADNGQTEGGGGITLTGSAASTLSETTLEGNIVTVQDPEDVAVGGGMRDDGTLTIDKSLLVNNSVAGGDDDNVNFTPRGGGLYAASAMGTTNVINSTFSGNQAVPGTGGSLGGGILGFTATQQLVVVHTTFTGNSAAFGDAINVSGGNFGPNLTLRGSLFDEDGNFACFPNGLQNDSNGFNVDAGETCAGTTDDTDVRNATSGGIDLQGLSPNGGFTRTHALGPGSVAIDRMPTAQCLDLLNMPLTVDQRGTGFPRPDGMACEAGSFEVADNDDDNDGVLDVSDGCPLQAGPASNSGCPLIPVTPITPVSPTTPTNTNDAACAALRAKLKKAKSKKKKKKIRKQLRALGC